MSRVTSLGAAAPGTITAPTTRSEHGYRFSDCIWIRSESSYAAAEDIVQVAQPFQVTVNDMDRRSESDRHLRGVGSDNAASDNSHPRGHNAGDSSQQNAAPSVDLLKIGRAHLDCIRLATRSVGDKWWGPYRL